MGDLKDQLKKARLLSEKDAKRIAHEQRVVRHEKGREGIEAEAARKREELLALQAEQREKTREAQAKIDAARKEAEARARVAVLVRQRAVRGVDGPRRFYFVTRSGRIPFVSVGVEAARALEGGVHAIVEVPGSAPEAFVIVDRRTAGELLAVEPGLVRFLVDQPPAGAPPAS